MEGFCQNKKAGAFMLHSREKDASTVMALEKAGLYI
ncbi:hypothetical protein SOVF_045770 [Spinacia oleracea]|nr:hypothetical protein SOVF_045770 [Spinacia oleracea]